MNNELKTKFQEITAAGGNETSINQFLEIIDLPDEKFNAIYPTFKVKLSEIFESQQFQKDIMLSLETNPIEDFEAEIKIVENFLEEIKNDNSLSDNKKDLLITIIEKTVLTIYDKFKNPREKIKVKIQKISEDAIIPTYAHDSDAGCDVYAVEETILKPHTTVIVKTGIKVGIPAGYEIQIRPRSGLSAKTPLRVANAPGTIDSNYRGEVGVIIENTGNLTQTIAKGDRIAQMIIAPSPMIAWNEVDELEETDRNEGGFGSSGN